MLKICSSVSNIVLNFNIAITTESAENPTICHYTKSPKITVLKSHITFWFFSAFSLDVWYLCNSHINPLVSYLLTLILSVKFLIHCGYQVLTFVTFLNKASRSGFRFGIVCGMFLSISIWMLRLLLGSLDSLNTFSHFTLCLLVMCPEIWDFQTLES